ncbi:hypothetical protein B0H14DRAFT_3495924 [Mycena olivaceomarginata]|nr:hypothetical protein B0H14DRAFT_3495924 [Mycena olivaceomarginata]
MQLSEIGDETGINYRERHSYYMQRIVEALVSRGPVSRNPTPKPPDQPGTKQMKTTATFSALPRRWVLRRDRYPSSSVVIGPTTPINASPSGRDESLTPPAPPARNNPRPPPPQGSHSPTSHARRTDATNGIYLTAIGTACRTLGELQLAPCAAVRFPTPRRLTLRRRSTPVFGPLLCHYPPPTSSVSFFTTECRTRRPLSALKRRARASPAIPLSFASSPPPMGDVRRKLSASGFDYLSTFTASYDCEASLQSSDFLRAMLPSATLPTTPPSASTNIRCTLRFVL